MQIDTVLYFTITEPKSVTYEVANPLQAIEQLTVTTLRNVIGGMTLEQALTSRDNINSQLRVVLDEATGRWGIRINRVELKSIDPPGTIQEAMEKQMRAERDRRAAILTAEGVKQSQILTAEGEQQAAVLRATGERQAAILRAEGEAKAIDTVFSAIHEARPDAELLSYQYLQALPKLAQGEGATVYVIPAELTQALGSIGDAFGREPQRAIRRCRRPASLRGWPNRPTPRTTRVDRRWIGSSGCNTVWYGCALLPRPAWSRAAAHAGSRLDRHVRHARREAAGHARRRARARHADRGRRQRRDARDPPRAARGRRQLQGRQVVHDRGQGAGARQRRDRAAQPRPAGRQDRRRGAVGADGRRRAASWRSRPARRR